MAGSPDSAQGLDLDGQGDVFPESDVQEQEKLDPGGRSRAPGGEGDAEDAAVVLPAFADVDVALLDDGPLGTPEPSVPPEPLLAPEEPAPPSSPSSELDASPPQDTGPRPAMPNSRIAAKTGLE